MKPMASALIRSVGHTGITVSNLGRAIAFYRDVLGLPVSETVRASGPLFEKITGVPGADLKVCFVRAPGLIIELLQYVNPPGKPSMLRQCDPGAFHLAIKVQNIEEVVAASSKAGFKAFGDIQTIPEGPVKGMRVVYARDPDGVVLEIIEEPPGIVMEEVYFAARGPSSVS
jgi:catechol 2,3-dioxygenase-like lactoylglutathione lyase family enzyme